MKIFESVFQSGTDIKAVAIMAAPALVCGIAYAWITSRKLRSSKGLFLTLALIPSIVGIGIALLTKYMTDADASSGVTRIATIAIALGLLRFRSNNGRAEEILLLLGAVVSGFVFGLGYVAYASLFLVAIGGLYVGLSTAPLFKNKRFEREKLLKITVPETLDYSGMFDDVFARYLKEHELVGVKTTGMGSMFRLSYRIVQKDPLKEKALIDELRIRNGNLEISLLPFALSDKEL